MHRNSIVSDSHTFEHYHITEQHSSLTTGLLSNTDQIILPSNFESSIQIETLFCTSLTLR